MGRFSSENQPLRSDVEYLRRKERSGGEPYGLAPGPRDFKVVDGELVEIPNKEPTPKATASKPKKEKELSPEFIAQCLELKTDRIEALESVTAMNHEIGAKADECDRVESLYNSAKGLIPDTSPTMIRYQKEIRQCNEELGSKRQELNERSKVFQELDKLFKKRCPQPQFQD